MEYWTEVQLFGEVHGIEDDSVLVALLRAISVVAHRAGHQNVDTKLLQAIASGTEVQYLRLSVLR